MPGEEWAPGYEVVPEAQWQRARRSPYNYPQRSYNGMKEQIEAIEGIGPRYAEMLEAAGIGCISDLLSRRYTNCE